MKKKQKKSKSKEFCDRNTIKLEKEFRRHWKCIDWKLNHWSVKTIKNKTADKTYYFTYFKMNIGIHLENIKEFEVKLTELCNEADVDLYISTIQFLINDTCFQSHRGEIKYAFRTYLDPQQNKNESKRYEPYDNFCLKSIEKAKKKECDKVKIPKELLNGHANKDLYITRNLRIHPTKYEKIMDMLQYCDITILQATKMLKSDKTIEEDLKKLGISL